MIARLNVTKAQGARKDEDKFDYNKDADRFICPAGHIPYERLTMVKKMLEPIKYKPTILMWKNVRPAL